MAEPGIVLNKIIEERNYVVLGAKVKCDCGSRVSYLLNNKKTEMGNGYVMLDTDTNKSKHFTNSFGICSAKYGGGKECTMDFIKTWYGANKSIIYNDWTTGKLMDQYYGLLDDVQVIIDGQRENFRTVLMDKYNSDFYRVQWEMDTVFSIMPNIQMSSIRNANSDISQLNESISRMKEKSGIKEMEATGTIVVGPTTGSNELWETFYALKEAQNKLNQAEKLLSQIAMSPQEAGSPLLETSALICKKGGVISIIEDGQKYANVLPKHGFTADLQSVYFQGYKYQVYVPPQPQTVSYANLSKDWIKIHSIDVYHAGVDFLKALTWDAVSSYPSEESYKINNSVYQFDIEDADHLLVTGEYSTTHYVDQAAIAPNGRYQKTGARSMEYSMNYSPGTTQHKVSVVASLIPELIKKIEKNIVRYDVIFDFFVINGERKVVIRWNDHQLNDQAADAAWRTGSKADWHFQYHDGISEGIEEILLSRGYVKAPPYGNVTLGMDDEALAAIGKEREEFIRQNPGKKILPDLKSSASEYTGYRYNYSISYSPIRSSVDELGYLHYNSEGVLISTEIIYEDDELFYGISRFDNVYIKFIPLLDIKTTCFPQEAYPIYHYLIYNYGNSIFRISKGQLLEDFESGEWKEK